jgi:hypothetical protein
MIFKQVFNDSPLAQDVCLGLLSLQVYNRYVPHCPHYTPS